MDINKLKREQNQKEAKELTNTFRETLHKHFDIVKYKARKLIDDRWKE